MSNKIQGPALCGFADYFDGGYTGEDLVGATKLPSAKPGKAKPGAPKPPNFKPYPKAKQSGTIAQHAKVLTHARQVLAKAHGKVKTAARKTIAKPAAPVARVRGARISVQGDDYVVIGAALPAAQQPKVKAARAKLAAAREKVHKAAAVAAQKTKAAHVTVSKLAAQVKNHEAVARKLSSKNRQHGLHGYIGYDANGLAVGDPGYDPTTEDGMGGGTDAGFDPTTIDPSTGAPASSSQLDLDTLVTAANAAGTVPPDQYIADCTTVPAIVYDGSKGTPDGYVLSYGLATRASDVGCEPDTAQIEGNAHFGYVFGRYDKSDPANGGIGWGSHLAQNAWNHVHGRFWLGDDSWHDVVDAGEAFASAHKAVDLGLPGTHASGYQTAGQYGKAFGAQTYGPLVGNPALADFKGMRVDGNGVMFWMANEAPDWLTFPLKAQAALTKAAADKAQKDADAAAAAAAAKAAADAAAAQAAQAAQNALDEANAASAATQQQYAAQGAQAQSDADYGASQAQSAQQDVAERQFMLQQAQAQAAADAADYAAQQQYAQQQQQYAPPQQGGGGGFVDDGGGDDGGGFDPEAASDEEAAAIDDESEVLGAADALASVLGVPTIAGDDAVIGGDGEVIGIDQWGNVQD